MQPHNIQDSGNYRLLIKSQKGEVAQTEKISVPGNVAELVKAAVKLGLYFIFAVNGVRGVADGCMGYFWTGIGGSVRRNASPVPIQTS